jgi:hypothetical protein
MTRAILLVTLTVLCLAQTSRDDYRAAYRAWRQADPNLEQEAATGGAGIAQRADRMASEAAKSAAARKSFLDSVAQDEARQVDWLEKAASLKESAATSTDPEAKFIATESAAVTRTMETFANDPDRGIQQLRQALVRERIALDGLAPAVAQRKKIEENLHASAATLDQARAKALEQSRSMLEAFQNMAAETGRESDAWVEYYRKLGEGAQGAAAPITEVAPGVESAVLNNPRVAPPTITPLPLARYTGAWTWPAANGLFHGAQPEFIDVVVHEENGRATGSGFARFKLPEGSKGDPLLRFDFTGDFKPTRNQILNLVTSDGTKGTIELIPGPAFNLLEVNIQTEPKEGKIRQADVVLVKK